MIMVKKLMISSRTQAMAEAVQTKRTPLIALTSIKDYDEYTFNHSVNVCIYTTALADSLTTDSSEVVSISQAALLHDVGKILIADEILYKPGRLSESEWQVMRQHPLVGAKILLEAQGVDELAVNVAFGHHLRHDRSGYPPVAREVQLDPVTELVNVVDVYEAVTAKRPYKKPFPPERVAEMLLEGAGKEFEALCVEAFVNFYGVYPPGTRIRLSDGAEARVLMASPEDPFRPRVQVVQDPEGQPLDTLEIVEIKRIPDEKNLSVASKSVKAHIGLITVRIARIERVGARPVRAARSCQ